MKNLREFGTIVQEGRLNKDMTTSQLAAAAKISATTISKIEKGEYNINIDEAFAVKTALDIPLSSLLALFAEADADVLTRLKIIEYCDDLGTDKVMEIIKSLEKK